MQGVRDGSVDFTVVGTPMNQEFPMMLISDWPFLYRDLEHAMNVWTGEVADEVSAAFDEKFPEVEMLSWGQLRPYLYFQQASDLCGDFAGQKFRMPNNPIHIGIVEDLAPPLRSSPWASCSPPWRPALWTARITAW